MTPPARRGEFHGPVVVIAGTATGIGAAVAQSLKRPPSDAGGHSGNADTPIRSNTARRVDRRQGGNPGIMSYSASWAGLMGTMVKSMATDGATARIPVNGLAPAIIMTLDICGDASRSGRAQHIEDPRGSARRAERSTRHDRLDCFDLGQFSTGFTFDLPGGRATN